jgi:membrane protein implicated in regulation of membrane protease activity
MSGWILWLIAAFAFGLGELLSAVFFLVPFALGAVVAAIFDGAGAGGVASLIAFIVISLAALVVIRVRVAARMQARPPMRTDGTALIGKHAIVLERIANKEGVGCITVEGQVWTARAFDQDQVIEQGTDVEVVDVRGAAALVVE